MDNEFKLLKIVVDVAFKLETDVTYPFTDNEFILLNIVVDVAFKLCMASANMVKPSIIVADVAFKLLIDKVELADNEFILLNIVVDVAFIASDNELKLVVVAYNDKLGLLIIVVSQSA